MNLSRVLSIVFIYFVYHCLTESSELSNQTRELNRQLRQTSHAFQSGYLSLVLAAATTGRNFIKVPETVSIECARTAKAIMKLFLAPSSHSITLPIIYSSINKTIATLKSNTVGNLVEILCSYLDREASRIQNFDFETIRRGVYVEHPFDFPFMTAIPAKQTVSQYMKGGNMVFVVDARPLIEFGTIREFYSYMDQKSDFALRECMAVATAIHQLSQHTDPDLRNNVDNVFNMALQNFYLQNVQDTLTHDYNRTLSAPYARHFTRILESHVVDFPKLIPNAEYWRLKREALRRV